MAEPRSVVRFERVSKRFGDVTAVDAVDLDVREGEFLCLLGPSGCGKTTLLRMLAGFERPNDGRVLLDGADITDVPPHRRPVNMMFQSYALFPHMSVAGNIGFGLRQDGLARDAIAARVAEMLALVRLDGMGARRPHQLSGGQRQRVALARALAKRPRVLLLDEPMAALDRKLREETQIELKALQARLGLTFVTVTHDQDEAMMLADRIAVMEKGRLAQVAAPRDLYEKPATLFVARFIGDATVFDGVVRKRSGEGEWIIDCETPAVSLVAKANVEIAAGAKVRIVARPENIQLYPWRPTDVPNLAQGVVSRIVYRGDARLVLVDAEGVSVRVVRPTSPGFDDSLAPGAAVWLSIAPEALIVLAG